MKPLKIVFAWMWENSLDVVVRFDEGIGEVLRMLARDGHDVTISTWGESPCWGTDKGVHFDIVQPYPKMSFEAWAKRIANLEPDVVLGWGSIDHKIYPAIRKELPNVPILYFLAGGGVDHPFKAVFNHFFVETHFHTEDLGPANATKALGVMTDVLTPVKQPKVWDIFLPASFTPNKRYSLFADVVEWGRFRGVSVGPHNDEGCVIECEKVYALTFGYVSRAVLRDFYCASKVVVLTGGAWGGSQRTLLEALSCGIPVVACDDNFQLDWLRVAGAPVVWVPPQADMIATEVNKLIAVPPDPLELRQFVLDNFSARHYYEPVAAKIKEVTCAVTSSVS